MLNFQQPKDYSLEQALTIIEKISKYINDNPFELQQVGVFRESGTLSHSMKIIEQLLKHEKFYVKKYSIHDYIGALKHVLINTPLLECTHPAIIQLKEQIAALNDIDASLALKAYIEELGKSVHENEKIVSKIISTYLQLLSHALFFENKNMMSRSNLGIVAGPFFANHLENDPRKIVALTLKLNAVVEHLLGNGNFAENEITVPKSKMVLFLSKRKVPNKVNMHSDEKGASTKLKKK